MELLLILSAICFPLYFAAARALIGIGFLPHEWNTSSQAGSNSQREDKFILALKSAVGLSASALVTLALIAPRLDVQENFTSATIVVVIASIVGIILAMREARHYESNSAGKSLSGNISWDCRVFGA